MEAQSQGLACLSTRISGIPELIQDRKTGWLTEPGDPAALGEALATLIANPRLREAIGRAGQARVRNTFDMERGIDRLASLFGLAPATTGEIADPERMQACCDSH